MKKIIATIVLSIFAAAPLGCQAQGSAARARDRANEQTTVLAAAPIASAEPRSFALGAGDVLGERVFARAVVAAREAESEAGYRFASMQQAGEWQINRDGLTRDTAVAAATPRAILPAFNGNDARQLDTVDLRDRWATVTILRAERRPWLIDGRQFLEPVDANAAPAQWPVTAIVIPE